MGSGSSKNLAELPDDDERYYGLENFGNTCYCNSVLQALYFCQPFRQKVQTFIPINANEETLLTCLSELYGKIATQKKRTGVLAPRKFITKLRKDNGLFRELAQQDAHEFLNYLLNEVAETLIREKKLLDKQNGIDSSSDDRSSPKPPATWIHELFEGILTNETKCLCCETVTNRDETFFDLSVDIEQNSSVTGCLRNFSSSETLCHKDKFFCDVCSSLQEAEKRMKIKKLPHILNLHLKRFKFVDTGYRKLSYRVVFPLELRLFNTSDDAEDRDRQYELSAVVIHIGSGPNQGHYIAIVKSGKRWLIYDDDNVEPIDERTIQSFFGSTSDMASTIESGYILFYQATTLLQQFNQNRAADAMLSSSRQDKNNVSSDYDDAEQRATAKHDGLVTAEVRANGLHVTVGPPTEA